MTKHVGKDLSLNILGGWWTKAHDPKGREYVHDMGKTRTNKATSFAASVAAIELMERMGSARRTQKQRS